MASSLVTFKSVSFACSHIRPIFSLPSNPFVVSAFSYPKTANHIKLKHLPSASSSSEGLPTELIEDSKFVPLTAEDPQYGPPALLLLGFKVEEAAKIQQLLKGMDGEFLEVIFCTEDMITRSLWEAVNTKQPNLDTVKIAKLVPRICFLSGLTGEEMMMFVDAFPEIGLEPAVFAALVPNSADKPLQELIEEIMGDHEMLVWVEYDGINRQLDVTMSPINISKPARPLLSLTKDISPFLLEYMYVGFSSSTSSVSANHYILGWSFKMNGHAQQIDASRLLKLPRSREGRDDKQIKRFLAIVLPPVAFLLLLVLVFGFLFTKSMKKFMEVLEDGEVQYGPHRFRYKDLFIATKGFKELLGRGGFGRVYRGVLPTSNIQVAVKRVAHDSRQGLREFVKSRDFGEASNEQDVQLPTSVTSLTISEPFPSTGR